MTPTSGTGFGKPLEPSCAPLGHIPRGAQEVSRGFPNPLSFGRGHHNLSNWLPKDYIGSLCAQIFWFDLASSYILLQAELPRLFPNLSIQRSPRAPLLSTSNRYCSCVSIPHPFEAIVTKDSLLSLSSCGQFEKKEGKEEGIDGHARWNTMFQITNPPCTKFRLLKMHHSL